MNEICIKYRELLAVDCGDGVLTTGGDQYWLPKEGFIPGGACGTAAAANMFAYLLRTRPELYDIAAAAGLDGLADPAGADILSASLHKREDAFPHNSKSGYIEFMKKVYKFFYPRLAGLMANEFLEGVGLLSTEYGLSVSAESLRIPISRSKRPSFKDVFEFVTESFEADIPVAFLILSNGCVANLDTWHWVTALAISEETNEIEITDNGEVFRANLWQWLNASIMGGAFVRLRILNEKQR